MDELKLLRIMGLIGHRWKKVLRTFDSNSMNLPIGNTMERVIMVILKNPNCKMSELSQKVGLEKSSFTRVVDSLIEQGFAQREYGKNDRRKITVYLTDKGNEVAKKLEKLMCEHVKAIISPLSERDKKRLFELLYEANQILEKAESTKEENKQYGK